MKYQAHLEEFIPPNFNLSKYESAKDMPLLDWWGNLYSRRKYYWGDLGVIENNIDKGALTGHKYASNDPDIQHIVSGIYGEFSTNNIEAYQEKTNIVRDIRDDDLYDLTRWALDKKQVSSFEYEHITHDLVESYLPNNHLDEYQLSDSFDFQQGSIPEKNYYAYLQVDMFSSDNEIEKSFKDWLDNARKRMPGQFIAQKKRDRLYKTLSRANCRSWAIDHKILPYLDLVMWNHVNNRTNVKPIIYAQILFGLTVDGNKITDDTKPIAEKLISLEFLERLIKAAELYKENGGFFE